MYRIGTNFFTEGFSIITCVLILLLKFPLEETVEIYFIVYDSYWLMLKLITFSRNNIKI